MNFTITSGGIVSAMFLERSIPDFESAADYIRQLPYRRNSNKDDVTTVISDGCGTCSTKHALLAQLAAENGKAEIKLMLGIFRMNVANTPAVRNILERYGLQYIPEAHNYLRIEGKVMDCTKVNSSDEFLKDLLEEREIAPNQITGFKVSYHRQYLQNWIKQVQLEMDPGKLWKIREECILALSGERTDI